MIRDLPLRMHETSNSRIAWKSPKKPLKSLTIRGLLEVPEAADVPCAPVLSRVDMLEDPQVVKNDIVQTIDQSRLGKLRQARAAARFADTPCGPIRTAPALWEHGNTNLTELGLGLPDIDALRDSDSIK